MKRSIGITGGIGSGKTTVATLIHRLGYPVYYSDREASRLINENDALKQQLINAFGEHIYTEEARLNKPLYASLIFNNEEALQQSNRIIHPAVIRDFNSWSLGQDHSLLFFESAIIYEANLADAFDAVIYVSANVETRINRVTQRDHLPPGKVGERINNQLPENDVKGKADFIIYNNDNDMILAQTLDILNTLNTNFTQK